MSEKRYFKIFSERHIIGEQNKYALLFDVLDKIEVEDDTEIKNQLKTQKVNVEFLSADKNYLYNLILKSLNAFHSSKTFNLEIKEFLSSIEILFHKGLYDECLKIIKRTEVLAEECENFALMLDILTWKKKCTGYSLGLVKANEVNLSIDKYLKLFSNLKLFTDLYYQSNLLQSFNEKDSITDIKKEFKKIIDSNELKSENNALSFSAKIFYYLILSNYAHISNDKIKEYQYLQKLVDILNKSTTYSTENPLDYISIYNRLLIIKKDIDAKSFFEDISILKEFQKKKQIKKEIIEQRIYIHTNTNELEYYLTNNEYKNVVRKLKEIEKCDDETLSLIEPYHIIYFYYIQIISFIYVGQFNLALKHVNKILNDFDKSDRPQVYLRLEVLNVIIHFELKNDDLVTKLTKQIIKNDISKKLLLPFELTILTALNKIELSKNLSFKEYIRILQEVKNKIILENKSDDLVINSLMDNYKKWIDSKI